MASDEKIRVGEHTRRRPNKRGDRQKIVNTKAPDRAEGDGVQILGGGVVQGVEVESKSLGGSAQTQVEIGLDQNDRGLDGRRRFQS